MIDGSLSIYLTMHKDQSTLILSEINLNIELKGDIPHNVSGMYLNVFQFYVMYCSRSDGFNMSTLLYSNHIQKRKQYLLLTNVRNWIIKLL